jgi:hypothetical protein
MSRVIATNWTPSIFCLLVFGCASSSGPTYSSLQSTIPPIPPGEARIFLYTSFEYANALALEILVDGKRIRSIDEKGVFFVDLPSGPHSVICTKCAEPSNVHVLSESLGVGAIAYNAMFGADKGQVIRIAVTEGERCYVDIEAAAGAPRMVLIDPAQGRQEILDLPYIGGSVAGSAS